MFVRDLSEDTLLELLEDATFDGACEVVCNGHNGEDCGCEVEPDGRCPHGCKSILLHFGF